MAITNATLACSLLLQTIFQLDNADLDLRLDISPRTVDVGASLDLDMNCTFAGNALVAGIISLRVSRANTTAETDTELAAITILSPQTPHLMTQERITTAGHIDPARTSYLNLHWDRPRETQAGVYSCSMQGIDRYGHILTMTSSTEVTVNLPTIDVLLEKIWEMDNNTKSLLLEVDTRTEQVEICTERLDKANAAMSRYMLHFHNPPLFYNGCKYIVSTAGFRDIDESAAMCHLAGGSLAVVEDAAEYTKIQKYLETLSGIILVYINGTDEGHDGAWTLLSTNQPIPFEDWHDSGASTGTSYNCLTLKKSASWRMDDYGCHLSSRAADRRYMCKLPME